MGEFDLAVKFDGGKNSRGENPSAVLVSGSNENKQKGSLTSFHKLI
jgi:hypothetical protein